jgi:hypothetical protein
MDGLTSRIGNRFLMVTLFPNALLAGFVAFLLAAGAPDRRPSFSQAVAALNNGSFRDVVTLSIVIVIGSLALHPLQYPLIQIVEGYWHSLPFGAVAAQSSINRRTQEWDYLRATAKRNPDESSESYQAVIAAQHKLIWLPRRKEHLLPTTLGNVLRVGEARAAERYNLDIVLTLPRIFPLMSPEMRGQLNDRRNQLDASVRVSVVSLCATVISIVLLFQFDVWLFVPVGCYAVAWASYRASVAAAQGYCSDLAAAVDLYHLDMRDALHLERPANLLDELARNTLLSAALRGADLAEDEAEEIRYLPPTA